MRRLREIGEEFRHLRAGLEPVLGGQAPALVGRDHGALGDAEQRVMRLVVRGAAEIGLVGRDQGEAQTVGERDELRLDSPLRIEAVALDLDIEPRAEDFREALEPALRQVAEPRSQRPVDRAAGAAGQRDEALRVLERREGNMRVVAVGRIEPERRDEAHEILVAGLVLGQKHDRRARIVALDAAQKRGRRVVKIDCRLGADDRLDAALGELLREFEGAEQIVGVGDRQSRHCVGLGELGQRLDCERALAQRIGAVHVQMHEADGLQNRRVQELRVQELRVQERRVHAPVFASASARVETGRAHGLWMTCLPHDPIARAISAIMIRNAPRAAISAMSRKA